MKHTKKILLGTAVALSVFSLASCNEEIKGYVNKTETLKYTTEGQTFVTFGKMPKTKVSDSEVTSLGLASTEGKEKENEIITKGDDAYYKVASASVNARGLTKASTGETLTKGETYWFKMEDITWRVLEDDGTNYTLISEDIIAAQPIFRSSRMNFADDKTGYALGSKEGVNRYLTTDEEYAWTTQLGLDTEGVYIDSTKLQTMTFEQTVLDSDYAKGTLKKTAKILSEEELNSYSAFDTQAKKIAKTTDYARATGAWTSIESDKEGYGIYWLRDTSTAYDAQNDDINYTGMFKVVDEQGNIKEDYGFNTFGGVRPVIKVAKSECKAQ